MTPAVRAQYLQQMGIIAYAPRMHDDAVSSSVSSSVSSRKKPALDALKNTEHPQVFIRDPAAMLSDAQMHLVFLLQSDNLDWTSPAHQLIKKIIDAVELPDNAIAICFSSTIPFTLPEINKSAKIVAFGRGLTVSLQNQVIQTLTLTELQHNDSAKRQLWQELKAVKAGYGQ